MDLLFVLWAMRVLTEEGAQAVHISTDATVPRNRGCGTGCPVTAIRSGVT